MNKLSKLNEITHYFMLDSVLHFHSEMRNGAASLLKTLMGLCTFNQQLSVGYRSFFKLLKSDLDMGGNPPRPVPSLFLFRSA